MADEEQLAMDPLPNLRARRKAAVPAGRPQIGERICPPPLHFGEARSRWCSKDKMLFS